MKALGARVESVAERLPVGESMAKAYDLFVIGSGTAAMVVSHRVAAAGWKVAVADYRPFGGTCALRGSDPKKIHVGAVQAIDDVRRMTGRGVVATDAHIDWRQLIEFKRSFTVPVPANQEKGYAEKGIDTYHGRAQFTGHNTIGVDEHVFETRYVLLATGARPAPLGFPGEEHLITNEEFLELAQLPKRIVLVGGGYIAAEFSHIGARAGAHVTILQRGERLLPQFDRDLVGWLLGRFQELNIDVRTGHSVSGVARTGATFVVTAEASDRRTMTVEADLVVHAAGRIPDLDGLNVDAAGVERDERGHLRLNDFLQSVSNPSVYAAGDAAQKGPPLTPVASHDAKIVARNLLEGNRHTPDYRGVPSVAFTIPPIARVGLSEEEVRERGLTFRIKSQNVANWYSARRVAETVYGFKVLVEDGTERILGAHLVGPHADEVISIFGIGIRNDLTATALKSMIFAYPTTSSDVAYML